MSTESTTAASEQSATSREDAEKIASDADTFQARLRASHAARGTYGKLDLTLAKVGNRIGFFVSMAEGDEDLLQLEITSPKIDGKLHVKMNPSDYSPGEWSGGGPSSDITGSTLEGPLENEVGISYGGANKDLGSIPGPVGEDGRPFADGWPFRRACGIAAHKAHYTDPTMPETPLVTDEDRIGFLMSLDVSDKYRGSDEYLSKSWGIDLASAKALVDQMIERSCAARRFSGDNVLVPPGPIDAASSAALVARWRISIESLTKIEARSMRNYHLRPNVIAARAKSSSQEVAS